MKQRARFRKKLSILILLAVTGLVWSGMMAFPGTVDFLLSGNPGDSSGNIDKAVSSAKSAGKDWLKHLPKGRETYQIVQAAETWPRMIEATIDPPDVHVGDIQRLEVILQSQEKIVSVEAHIETDKDTVILPLKFVKEVTAAGLRPERYALDAENKLVAKSEAPLKTGRGIAVAADPPKLKYAAEWKVRDTHNTTYRTKFVAKDAAGHENSITLAWSDACNIPRSGAWNINSYGNCTISSPDGVDAGNATIATYTLTLNSTFAFNISQSITVSSGAIAIGSGGQILETYIWEADSDSDSYGTGAFLTQNGQPAGYTRRSTVVSTDCHDGTAQIYQDITGTSDSDQDGWAAGGGYGTICVGPAVVISGRIYYRDVNGNYTALLNGYALGFSECNDNDGARWRVRYADGDSDSYGAAATCVGNHSGYVDVGTDCNDSNSDRWQNVGGLTLDCDRDGYSSVGSATQCVGNSNSYNGRTYYDRYINSLDCGFGAIDHYMTSGSLGTDCNDGNGYVYAVGGGGSDRNHDQIIQESGVVNGLCVGAASPDPWYIDNAGNSCWLRGSGIVGYNQSSGVDGAACNSSSFFGN